MTEVTLHVEKYGDAGQNLVILHGLFGSADNWTSLGKQLGRNYQVYLIDQRNHGKSDHHAEWTYALMAQDLKTFFDKQEISKPIILGHSMGGKTAMKFASLFSKDLQKLIVVDIAPKYYPVHHRQIIDGLLAVARKQVNSRKEADSILTNFIPELPVRQFLLKNLIRSNGNYVWRMNLPVIHQKIETIGEPLHENEVIAVPTLFIRGGESSYILDTDQKLLFHHFPGCRLETIAHAGHWVQAEKPKEFLDVVNNFIAHG